MRNEGFLHGCPFSWMYIHTWQRGHVVVERVLQEKVYQLVWGKSLLNIYPTVNLCYLF